MKRRFRKRKVFKRQKRTFVFRFLRRRLGLEQICDRCNKPYPTARDARPVEEFVSGSVVALVFLEHMFGRVRYHVQFGRHATNGREMFISQMLQHEHLEDIAKVALMARRYIRLQNRSSFSSRR